MNLSSSSASSSGESDSESSSDSRMRNAEKKNTSGTATVRTATLPRSRVSKFYKSTWSSESEEELTGAFSDESNSDSDAGRGKRSHLAVDSYELLDVPTTHSRKGRKPVEAIKKEHLSEKRVKHSEISKDNAAPMQSEWDSGDEASSSLQTAESTHLKDPSQAADSPRAGEQMGQNFDEWATSATPTSSQIKTSSWLNKFLSHKKDHNNIILKPDIIPLNDMFLREFADFQASHPRPVHKDIFVQDSASGGIEIDTSVGAGTNFSTRNAPATMSNELDEEKEEDLDRKYDEMQRNRLSIASELMEDGEIEAEKAKNFKLRIFNLPYTIQVEEIVAIARSLKVKLLNCSIDIDKKTQMPRGSATAEIAPHKDIAKVIKQLHGSSFNGRPVRVEKLLESEKRRKSASMGGESRYFANNINVKCNICEAVGHKTADCPEEDLAPCHLCAQGGHEAANCPNIICFRCGDYGHNSRSCRNSATERPVLCTVCGSTTHEAKSCTRIQGRNGYVASKNPAVEGDLIRCMVCNALGHSLCRRTALTSDRTIYCPNCGEKGHTVECNYIGRITCRSGRFEQDNRRSSFRDETRRPSFGNSSGRVIEIVDNTPNHPQKRKLRSPRDGEEEGEIFSDDADVSMDEFMNHHDAGSRKRTSGGFKRQGREIEIEKEPFLDRRVEILEQRPNKRRSMHISSSDYDRDQINHSPHSTALSSRFSKESHFEDFTPLPHHTNLEPVHYKGGFRHNPSGHRQSQRFVDDSFAPEVVRQHYERSGGGAGHRVVEFIPHHEDFNRPRKGFKYRR